MQTLEVLGRRWIPGFVAALVIASLIGFWPGYFSHFPGFASSGWPIHFHLATIVAWLGMLVAQGSLATRGRVDLHRRIGLFSYALVPLVITGFVLATVFGQRRHPEPALIGATILDGSLFVVFYTLAIVNRKNAILHGRYMLLTAVAFVDPALGRATDPRVALPVMLALIIVIIVKTRAPAKKAAQPRR